VSPLRRRWVLAVMGAAASAANTQAWCSDALAKIPTAEPPDPVRPGRSLVFPRDHGAHLGAAIEWWYATGWLGTAAAPSHGFQLTFFRSRTGLAGHVNSRFAARHLLFAHAAVTVLPNAKSGRAGQHLHDQRLARWSGDTRSGGDLSRAYASTADTAVALAGWQLQRQDAPQGGSQWQAELPADTFQLSLQLQRTQPLLLQGSAGFSRKGPQEQQASHYVTEPQLRASVHLHLGAAPQPSSAPTTPPLQGQAWLDHEWADQLLHPEAVGWDWIGMNLFDGSALTAFVLRRADGSALWAGGSWRRAGEQTARHFAPTDVQMAPLRHWPSPSSGARYPVAWQLVCPAGRLQVHALLDAQELDSRSSTGTVYWEGLSELHNTTGERIGLGYLEMTGYAGRLNLGA
jgi:predicted secreted hydrolase